MSEPVRGILDTRENSAFIRTTGYIAGPTDVHVSPAIVNKYGLRQGDLVSGESAAGKGKFDTLTSVHTVNDRPPGGKRPEFSSLTPLFPDERFLLETTPQQLTTRVIDLITPIGKGQRALIVSPPKAGKTSVMQAIANGITSNHPECKLMVVLADERPEEVTDMRRSIDGEVIASTFDRPPAEHTAVVELAIERAKRLVEYGADVVVLLDSITRLGRAYNLSGRPSGKILSGGVDAAALHPLKRILGAARNVEDGGSLTIIATAMADTSSTADNLLFEELKSTGNAELRLDRKIAEKRVFPAVDINTSGTRREELLFTPEELPIIQDLRRALQARDSQHAIEQLLDGLRKTQTNAEFLLRLTATTPRRAA
jgi:transcription termination factor Rho